MPDARIRSPDERAVGTVVGTTSVSQRTRAPPVVATPSLADDAPDATVGVSRGGRVLRIGEEGERLFGRPCSKLVGLSLAEVGFTRRAAALCLRGVRRAYRTGQEQVCDLEKAFAGPGLYVVRMVPERDARSVVSSVLLIVCDVTRRVRFHRERERVAEERAEAASHSHDQFLAIVSHELRSPLNGIQSWSHVLENQMSGTSTSDVARRALGGIRAGIELQVALIEQLLDTAVAMTGDLRITSASFVIREAIETAVSRLRSLAIAKDVALHVDMRLIDERLDGDARRIQEVVGHLLSNAVKFTAQGGSIWLSARCEAASVILVVRDTGLGLPAGFERWLFEPFGQADLSHTRSASGIGLGLVLARRLTELHGGTISGESAGAHAGSTFTVRLPMERAPTPTTGQAVAPIAVHAADELLGLSVLVVDDQLEAREALSALLVQFGATVRVAASAREALDAIVTADTQPHIVICDIAMPDEDGYTFVRHLREYENLQGRTKKARPSHIPVMALSAFAQPEPDPAASGVGFAAHLVKPVTPQRLVETLTQETTRVRRAVKARHH